MDDSFYARCSAPALFIYIHERDADPLVVMTNQIGVVQIVSLLPRKSVVGVEMSCVTGGTTQDFPVATNRRQPNCVAPICQARFASGQKILFCLGSKMSPSSHFVSSGLNTRFYSNTCRRPHHQVF